MDVDFDAPLDRGGTHSVKWDEREGMFGRADVVPLWVADMDVATAPCVQAALRARVEHPLYSYTLAPPGLAAAVRAWHGARYGWDIDAETLLYTPGTLTGLGVIIEALTRAGEGVIIQPPVYGHFEDVIRGAGRRVVANPLREEDGHWSIDFADLERCLREEAKLLLLCNPHNPVGRIWNEADLRRLLGLARRHDAVIISDDIHGDLALGAARFQPLGSLAGAGDRVISGLSPSKTFNIQGLAFTAWVIPDAALRERITAQRDARQLFLFNPFSLVAAEAAWRDGGPWRDALVAWLTVVRDELLGAIDTRLAPLRATPPEAGYLLWLDARGLGLDDAALARFFVADCGLGLNPGPSFGAQGSGFMRLNFGAPRPRLRAAIDAITAALARR